MELPPPILYPIALSREPSPSLAATVNTEEPWKRNHTKELKPIQFFHDAGSYHIDTSPLIWFADQWTGFYYDREVHHVRVKIWVRDVAQISADI